MYVRGVLIEVDTEQRLQYFQEPWSREIVGRLVEVDTSGLKEGDPINSTKNRLAEALKNPLKAHELASKIAREYWLPKDLIRKTIEIRTGMDDKELQRIYGWRFDIAALNDKIVTELARIAESQGVDKIREEGIRYEVTRRFFPNAEDYRSFKNKRYSKAKAAYMKNPKHTKSQEVDTIMRLLEELDRKEVEMDISKIYGES